jgi:UDP-N-acetylglucosamine--N-acetylmuramyl-(pentapeptide) pyrophosphoryl-undecaprenol N-acetylglucosamine transferase
VNGAPTLLIMAAGTGGHIMPGLAVAETMRARGWQIRWLGTSHGMENRLVPAAGLALDTIDFAGLRGKGLGHALYGAWQLVAGVARCISLVRRVRPSAVLGMGGYVTVPGGVSAGLWRAPLVLLNSDASLLLSNRLLLPLARRILFGLPGPASHGAKAQWSGCPVRAEIAAVAVPSERFAGRSGPLRVLVVGGSLGAAVLNRVVPQALARMAVAERPIVTHQSGAQHVEALKSAYRDLGVTAEVLPFIDDMARRYAEADLVLCRAGAITVSELTVAGVASLLVPLTVSTTSHQRDNALYLEQAGAALHLPQKEFDIDALAALLRSLDRTRLLALAEKARALGKPDATQNVAAVIESVARRPVKS